MDWSAELGSLARLGDCLAERRWRRVRIRSIPNLRLAQEAEAQRRVALSDDALPVAVLRQQPEASFGGHLAPDQIWEIARAYGYDATVYPGQEGCFDVLLSDEERSAITCPPRPLSRKPWRAYANDPLENGFRQRMVSALREYAAGRLPDHMIPSAWVLLQDMPLTPSGKVDRRALPAPQSRA